MKTYSFTVSQKDAGERLGLYLSKHLPLKLSNKAIKRCVDQKHCRVNGAVETFASYKVKKGDLVEFVLYEEEKSSKKIEVLYEDEHLIVVNKPIQFVSAYQNFEKALSISPLYLVHRLDKDTSGALILAKTKEAKLGLENLFRTREVKKHYHAICIGDLDEDRVIVTNYLAPICEYEGGKILGEVEKDIGKFAKSIFSVIARKKGYLLIDCQIITGVTHQIRVHAKGLGIPVLGDFQYDKDQSFNKFAKRPMLHSYSIEFSHPIKGETVTMISPYPDDFKNAKETIFK